MRRTAGLHALDSGLDRIASDRLLLGTERRVQGKPCIAHLLVQRGVLLTRVVRDRGDRDEIGLGLSQLRLQRRLDLLEACACGIVRRRALRDRAVPLLLLRGVEIELRLQPGQHLERGATMHGLRRRRQRDGAQGGKQ